VTPSSNVNVDNDRHYVRFSRMFQRHVVRRAAADGVVRLFKFLDDAVLSYPNARVLAPRYLPRPPPLCSAVLVGGGGGGRRTTDANLDGEGCETSIAGMGLRMPCKLECGEPHAVAIAVAVTFEEEDDGDNGRRHRANDALRTLLRLV